MCSLEPIQMQPSSSLVNSFNFVLQQLAASNQQVSSDNQAILSFLVSQHSQISTSSQHFKIRPTSFSGLQSEYVLSWLDHFDNVAYYYGWFEVQKFHEVRTVFEGLAATWFVQQSNFVKQSWRLLKEALVRDFAHDDIAKSALQQLNDCYQKEFETVSQFAVRLKQILLRVDINMTEDMKLFFLWPRLRHDLRQRVKDQGPEIFLDAIKIAQRIEGNVYSDNSKVSNTRDDKRNGPVPMDIDMQNFQRRLLPARDAQGRPKCFNCNIYGHLSKNCLKPQCHRRKAKQFQNVQVPNEMDELPRNV